MKGSADDKTLAERVRALESALRACVRAMDVARDTIQPITRAQLKLHNLNPNTARMLDEAAERALGLLSESENEGKGHG